MTKKITFLNDQIIEQRVKVNYDINYRGDFSQNDTLIIACVCTMTRKFLIETPRIFKKLRSLSKLSEILPDALFFYLKTKHSTIKS